MNNEECKKAFLMNEIVDVKVYKDRDGSIDCYNYYDEPISIRNDNDMVVLETADYVMVITHFQDCCESVSLAEFDFPIEEFIGDKITDISVVSNKLSEDEIRNDKRAWNDSVTWTFIKITGMKSGTNTLFWHGSSNGWYSETPDINFYKKHL